MDAIECLKSRRSIRKYTSEDITDEEVNEILDCARHAPSSHNCQSWEFIVVRDVKKKERLSQLHPWCSFVKNAPVTIVVCYNKERINFQPSADFFTPAIAAENILLAAHALGLGGCWVYIKDNAETEIEKEAKKILNLPNNLSVICQIPLGHPDEKPGKKKLLPMEEIVHKQ